jgi:hypothetical protein
VQPFYRRVGGGGAGRDRAGGGMAVGNRRPRGACSSGMGGFGVGRVIWMRVGWGLLGAIFWHGSPAQGCPTAWWCFSAGRRGAAEGREERGRERRAKIQIKFSQNFE